MDVKIASNQSAPIWSQHLDKEPWQRTAPSGGFKVDPAYTRAPRKPSLAFKAAGRLASLGDRLLYSVKSDTGKRLVARSLGVTLRAQELLGDERQLAVSNAANLPNFTQGYRRVMKGHELAAPSDRTALARAHQRVSNTKDIPELANQVRKAEVKALPQALVRRRDSN